MLTCNSLYQVPLHGLLARYGIGLRTVAHDAPIPGTYWGEPEAGLIGTTVYVRGDTPVHSALHETAHLVCMTPPRRARLHADAGGDYAEEDAVCYLQVVLAGCLDVPAAAICADMDAWGYTFRFGSAYAWFTRDAAEARAWLIRHDLLTRHQAPTWRCRGATAGVRLATAPDGDATAGVCPGSACPAGSDATAAPDIAMHASTLRRR